MNDNTKAGADMMAGDGGYSIGTKEKYDEFVKMRNQNLGTVHIQELAEQASDAVAGSAFSMSKYNEKFAELIVRECTSEIRKQGNGASYDDWDRGYEAGLISAINCLHKHFGVEE